VLWSITVGVIAVVDASGEVVGVLDEVLAQLGADGGRTAWAEASWPLPEPP
jgi:hypothetical protein